MVVLARVLVSLYKRLGTDKDGGTAKSSDIGGSLIHWLHSPVHPIQLSFSATVDISGVDLAATGVYPERVGDHVSGRGEKLGISLGTGWPGGLP